MKSYKKKFSSIYISFFQQFIIAVSGIHQSEGVPVVGPLIKAKLETAGEVGWKVKLATIKKWEAVKATGGAVVSVITAPLKVLYKTVAIKFGALKALLGFKAAALKGIVTGALVHATTTTTVKPLPLKELEHFVPAVFSNIHKGHFVL